MKKVLFLIHDLGPGGAEKVLVNLVNHMDHEKFDITVLSLFHWGVNRQFLSDKVHYRCCFRRMPRGNTQLMKLLPPGLLHRWLVGEEYDVEISCLEGPCARIISGCQNPNTQKVAWIHSTVTEEKVAAIGFRSLREARECYSRMDRQVFVSQGVRDAFLRHIPGTVPAQVLYNTNETAKILAQGGEPIPERPEGLVLCGMGKLTENKGFDRLLRIHGRLRRDGLPVHTWILGEGPRRGALEAQAREEKIQDSVRFLGYQVNPYKYLARSDLFVCASHAEGFSTAATEALILGTPVCTVEVSGMREMLGPNNEWGVVVPNDTEKLYRAIRELCEKPQLLAHYRTQAQLRGRDFSTEQTVQAVQEMLLHL